MSEHSNPTQNERIISYMDEFGSITPLEAMRDLGVMRLASRITDLKKRGYPIVSDWEKTKNRWGKTCRFKRYKRIYDRILGCCHPVEVSGVSRRRQALKESYADVKAKLGL